MLGDSKYDPKPSPTMLAQVREAERALEARYWAENERQVQRLLRMWNPHMDHPYGGEAA